MNDNLRESFKDSKLVLDFKIIEKLGEGGFGRVFKVQSKTDKKYSAVKVTEYDENEQVIREIKNLSKLDHKHIVRYHNSWMDTLNVGKKFSLFSGSSDGKLTSSEASSDTEETNEQRRMLFINMEFCPNGTLKDAIENDLYKNKSRVVTLFKQICDGLKHIHGKKIIHRDLKPSNIFFNSQGRIKIGDFGWSRQKSYKWRKPFSMTSSCGTFPYAAPEVSSNNERVYNEKVDIYSLGIILFEMCYKFSTGSERIKVLNNLRQSMDIPDDFNEEFHFELEIIKSALTRDFNRRPSIFDILDKIAPANNQLGWYLNYPAQHHHDKSFNRNLSDIDITFNSLLELITNSMSQVCKKHGAVLLSLPLFMPKKDEYYNRQDCLSLVDGNNINMSIPQDPRVCFMKWIELNNITEMRGFCMAKRMQKRQQSVVEETECYFDIIQTQKIEILHQLEIVAVVDKVLQAIIPVNKHFKIKIGSKDAFDDILSFFKLDTQTKSKVIRILSEPEVDTQRLRDCLSRAKLESNVITDFLRLCNGNPSEHTKVLQKISDGNPSFKSKWQLIKKLLAQVKILEIQCKVAYAPLMTFSTGLYTSILFQIECKKQKQKFLVGSGGCYKVNSASNTDVYGIGVTLKVHQIAKCIQSNEIFLKINYVDVVIYCDDTDFDANLLRVIWNSRLSCQVRPLKPQNDIVKCTIPAGCRWCIVKHEQVRILEYDENKHKYNLLLEEEQKVFDRLLRSPKSRRVWPNYATQFVTMYVHLKFNFASTYVPFQL